MRSVRCLILAVMLSTLAQAQGLVGAPVDPRYGQSNEVGPGGNSEDSDSWLARLVRVIRARLGL